LSSEVRRSQEALKIAQLTIDKMKVELTYLSFQKDDPWADYWKTKQTLTAAMKTLGYKPAKTAA
jgi:hypothetical protein